MRTVRSGLKCFVLGIAMFELLIALPNGAQQVAASPKESFDVLSVKQVYSHSEPGITSAPRTIPCVYQPDRMRCQLTLRHLIEEAYQVDRNAVDDPNWTNDQDHWFAIEGMMPPGTTKETARMMLQQGLAERFGLKVHWEKRDIPVYALVPGRNGVKLQPLDDPEHPKPRTMTLPNGVTTGVSTFGGEGEFFAAAITMDSFAQQLQTRAGLDRPVVNLTSLTGVYTIDLHWMPPDPPSYVDPAILTVVESKLGLRLEKRTVPFNVLVVDHVEKAPSAN